MLEKSKLEQARGKIKKINKLKRKLNPNVKAIEAAEREYEKILNNIDMESIEDETLKDIITAYYLHGLDWTDVGEMFFMHRTTAQKKVKKFLDMGE